jgi:hypothetical protein
MRDMWRLVTRVARDLDVQVFATTHSLDCIRGLAQLCDVQPEAGRELSLQKIHSDLQESVPLGADELPGAVEQGIEVR